MTALYTISTTSSTRCLCLLCIPFLQQVPPRILYITALYTISTTSTTMDIVYVCFVYHFYNQFHQVSLSALYTISTTSTTKDIVYDCIIHHFYNQYHQRYCVCLLFIPFLQPVPPGILSMTELFTISTISTTRDIVYDCIVHHFYNQNHQGYCL